MVNFGVKKDENVEDQRRRQVESRWHATGKQFQTLRFPEWAFEDARA